MASPGPWFIEPISKSHDRSAFDCGSPPLNRFLREFARQNDDRGFGRTFVAVHTGEKGVVGFFTACAGEIDIRDLPPEHARRLPKHPVPSIHLARLAVDRAEQGKGLGEFLLLSVIERTVLASKQIGVYALEVVAKSESAKRFYKRYGFMELRDDPLHLYLPVETARGLFEQQLE